MYDYRIVELRPDVFGVERYESTIWFLPWIKDWVSVRDALHYDRAKEFETHAKAEEWVTNRQEVELTEHLRRCPPQGYPKPVKTFRRRA